MKFNINQDQITSDDGIVDITVVAGDPEKIKKALELYDVSEIRKSSMYYQQLGRVVRLRKPYPVDITDYMLNPRVVKIVEERDDLLHALTIVRDTAMTDDPDMWAMVDDILGRYRS